MPSLYAVHRLATMGIIVTAISAFGLAVLYIDVLLQRHR